MWKTIKAIVFVIFIVIYSILFIIVASFGFIIGWWLYPFLSGFRRGGEEHDKITDWIEIKIKQYTKPKKP